MPRARLLKKLNRGLERTLTLVSAPAGYGKSTLLSEWVRQTGVPVAWLSLDKGDNDPRRFWSYFVSSLHTILDFQDAWSEKNLQQLSSVPENETLLADLITEITTIPERVALILDDLQTITEDEVLDGLFYLLDNLPPGPKGMHLIIASRNDPPWPLARLRACNQITEIRARDLSFTFDETSVFINDVMGLALSPGEIAELDQRTEGWIAGLQMAALSMQGRDDIAGFLAAFTGSHRFVLDYLVEEVLNNQTPEILDFLLRTSILGRLTGSLCDTVTGNNDGSIILMQLEKANLFLLNLDEQRTWYRYHTLFADLLQKQLRTKYPEQLPELHRQASLWYAQNGFPIEAVEHAVKSEDWDFAAAQVEENVLELIQRGEMSLAQSWVRSLPEEAIRPRPILCVAQAWTSAQYATVSFAEDLLAQAQAALTNESAIDGCFDQHDYALVSRQIAVLQVVIARVRGDSTYKQQELALEALDHIVPSDDTALRATLFLRLGFCYLDLGKDDQASKTFSQAFELGRSSKNHYAAYSASYGRMVIAWRHGQLHQLAAICRQTLDDDAAQDRQGRSLNGIALTMLGNLYYEWNGLDEAERLLIQGLALVEQAGITELLIKGHFAFACVKVARANNVHFPNLEKMADSSHPGLRRYAAALQVHLQLLLAHPGKDSQLIASVIGWVETQHLNFRAQPTYDWEMREKFIYARVLCRQYETLPNSRLKTRLQQILDFIEGQIPQLEELDWRGILLEVNIVIALILYTLERKNEALTAMEKALNLAESPGYLRTFLDEGQPMKELLKMALAEGICEAYTRKLISAFGDPIAKPQSITPQQPGAFIDPLSKRELQVLRLLKTSLSVPEIAEEMHLSPTTVRTHVQHIYQKLGVHGRLEALQKAEVSGIS